MHTKINAEKINIRLAQIDDLPAMVEMLADDPLGGKREDAQLPLKEGYTKAFHAIQNDPQSELWVMEINGQVAGMAQVNYLTHLVSQGKKRAHIEGVRIRSDFRSQGLGKILFDFLVQQAKQKNCHLLQLTTNKIRKDALRFYEKLGFVPSHHGLKLEI